MIRRKTVLVLGAGASHPYGFPLGTGLAQRIRLNLQSQATPYFEQIRKLCELPDNPTPSDFYAPHVAAFAAHFDASDVRSIDRFLLHNDQYATVAKAAIAQVLLSCEEAHQLINVRQDHWYQYLADQMEAPFDELARNQVSVISFNYDRSLEEYLYRRWCNTHPRHQPKVASLVNGLSILHVHGHLGPLEWQPDAEHARPYRSTFENSELLRASRHIRTIYEARAETFETAKQMLLAAERIIFLGFAYDAANLSSLGVASFGDHGKEISGTAFELTDLERNEIKRSGMHTIKFGHDVHRSLDFLRHTVTLAG